MPYWVFLISCIAYFRLRNVTLIFSGQPLLNLNTNGNTFVWAYPHYPACQCQTQTLRLRARVAMEEMVDERDLSKAASAQPPPACFKDA